MNHYKLGTLFLTLALSVGCNSDRFESGAPGPLEGDAGETGGAGGSTDVGMGGNGSNRAGAESSGSGGDMGDDSGAAGHGGTSGSMGDDAGTGRDGGLAGSGGEMGEDAGPRSECAEDMVRECWEDELGNPLPALTGEPKGSCHFGTQTCTAAGAWGPCQGAVAPEEKDRCDVAGADDDCNGVANENCTCTGSETRECGTDVGNCKLGTQTCEGATWGDCKGNVEPAGRDSCTVAGDDANCNGIPNEGCECTNDSPGACDDGISCTDDVCNNGKCSNPIKSGSCRIGGVCYNHNANDPGNSCRYCDTGISQTS